MGLVSQVFATEAAAVAAAWIMVAGLGRSGEGQAVIYAEWEWGRWAAGT